MRKAEGDYAVARLGTREINPKLIKGVRDQGSKMVIRESGRLEKRKPREKAKE